MPRSAADATRFTATGPYAHSRNSHASTISFSEPAPNETPAQKVARLREASRRAKLAQESQWDKVYVSGRKFVDKAHRLTVMGLVVLSGGSIIVAAWSLGSMALYNKKKKAAFIEEQERNYNKAVTLAYEAERQGKLTGELALILNKERALLEADAEKKKQQQTSLWQRAKTSVFGGLSKEEQPGGQLGLASDNVKKAAAIHKNATVAAQIGRMLMESEADARSQADGVEASTPNPSARRKGGPLDQLGEQAAASLATTTKSWTSWLTGR